MVVNHNMIDTLFEIQLVNEIKYLGKILDNQGSGEGIIRRIKKFIDSIKYLSNL